MAGIRSGASKAAIAVAGVLVGASLVGGVAWAGDSPNGSEDEDAYVQLRPVGARTTGYGTGFLNQVQYRRNGVVYKNVVNGALTFYGLPPNSNHVIYIGTGGTCPGSRGPALGSVIKVRTDAQGGWHGDIHFNLGAKDVWVVKEFDHRLVVSLGSNVGSSIGPCGTISDDPNIE